MPKSEKRKRNYSPVTVPFGATPVGEPVQIAQWAHVMVWTERLLATLQTGVKGGRWHTLFDKVMNPENLYASACKVLNKKGAAGVDRQTVDDFGADRFPELARLESQLREDSYCKVAKTSRQSDDRSKRHSSCATLRLRDFALNWSKPSIATKSSHDHDRKRTQSTDHHRGDRSSSYARRARINRVFTKKLWPGNYPREV